MLQVTEEEEEAPGESIPMMAEENNKMTITANDLEIHRPVYTQKTLMESLQWQEPQVSIKDALSSKLKNTCACSKDKMKKKMLTAFPFINTLCTYKWKEWLPFDVMAGISVGAIHVPQSMGFALLTGVPAVYGLYSSFYPVLIYFFFGTSRFLSMGTMAIISLMIGAVVTRELDGLGLSVVEPGGNSTDLNYTMLDDSVASREERFRVDIAMSMSFLIGAIQIIMSLLNLGVIATYMSMPFVRGFLTGAAFHIVTSQIPFLLGIKMKPLVGIFKLPRSYVEIAHRITTVNVGELITAIICLAVLIILKEIINEKYKSKLKAPIPAELLVVILGTIISHFSKLNHNFEIRVVGDIPRGLPPPVMPSLTNWSNYIADAFIAALVSFAISISMAKMLSMKHKQEIDTNQELLSYGLCNGVGALFQCFGGCQAPPRTLVHESSGGKSQVANLFSSALLLIVCLWIGPYFKSLPNAVLASIITVALFPLFKQLRDLHTFWPISKWDFYIWLITWLCVVILDLSIGLMIGMGLSIFMVVLHSQVTKGEALGNLTNTEIYAPVDICAKSAEVSGIKIFRFSSSLFFVNVDSFKQQLFQNTVNPQALSNQKMAEEKHENGAESPEVTLQMKKSRCPTKNGDENEISANNNSPIGIIIDCSGMTYIDIMGLTTLKQLNSDYNEHGIKLCLANCSRNIINKLNNMGLVGDEPKCLPIYPTIHDAVLTIYQDSIL